MKEAVVNGRAFIRALSYAIKVCPSSESASRLAHVVFIDNRIVCSDGVRWHVGLLGVELASPIVVTKESCEELLLGANYADKIARRHGGSFVAKIKNLSVELHYAERVIYHTLLTLPVGPVPTKWIEPVPNDAPPLTACPELHCQHLKDATAWWRSWEHDKGQIKQSGAGGNSPVRLDISVDGEPVAIAFLLPTSHKAAQLPLDEPLFAGKEAPGQSILDLSFHEPMAQTIKIGETEINVTGLGNPGDIIKSGPCSHREDTESCLTCTESHVSSLRLLEPAPGVKRRRRKKAEELEVAND